jgi:hypothetical protein
MVLPGFVRGQVIKAQMPVQSRTRFDACAVKPGRARMSATAARCVPSERSSPWGHRLRLRRRFRLRLRRTR